MPDVAVRRAAYAVRPQGFALSVRAGTLLCVEVIEADIVRIPPGNLRVPRAEFVAVWVAAERRCAGEWYAAGVALTCRWIGGAVVRAFDGRLAPARAPVTKRTARAYEELIQAEYLAAEALDQRRPRPWWLDERAGWIEGVCATLRWAWIRSGPPPIELRERNAG